MNASLKGLIAFSALAAIAAGCGGKKSAGSATPTPNPNEPQAVQDARVKFPRFLDLQVGVLSSTCSPNPGVCHNSNNYPNLETAGNTLAFVGAPCNAEIPDPLQGWDNCERAADRMTVGGYSSEIAWMRRIGPGTWSLGLKTPAAGGLNGRPSIRDKDGNLILDPPVDWGVMVVTTAGGTAASLSVGGDDFIHDFVDSVLKTVIGGDPNRNGVYGAEDTVIAAKSGAVFYPGSPDRSYMWGRITETVPGTRMPLANAPLTEPAYVAIACWIEGLQGGGADQAEDPIDYTNCQFALDPIDYTAVAAP